MCEQNVVHEFNNFIVEDRKMDFAGSQQDYQIVRREACVIIVPEKTNSFIMINEFRPSIDDCILQFPAGKIEKGEEPRQAAKRELLEETGYDCSKLIDIGKFYTAVHFSDEIMHVFIAQELTYKGQSLTKREKIVVEEISYKEIIKSFNNKQLDAKTVVAYYLWKGWYEDNDEKGD